MRLLIGEYQTKLTEKNRLAIPKQFRDVLGKEIVVTKGYEQCLWVVSVKSFDAFLYDLNNGPFLAKSIRETVRFLVGSACQVRLDKQGRFVVPQHLLKYSDLKRDVVFIGLSRWLEIWDKNKWEERIKDIEKRTDMISSEVIRLIKDKRNEKIGGS
uniref:Transcriptional regulator MraZ n=1 Tax=candidate division CPR3 bacterium TaxID=2268181 RepID=A0A7C5USE7_UNCC3